MDPLPDPLEAKRRGDGPCDCDHEDGPAQPGRWIFAADRLGSLQSGVEQDGHDDRSERGDRPGDVVEPVQPLAANDLPEKPRGRKPDDRRGDDDLGVAEGRTTPDGRRRCFERRLRIEDAVD